MIPYSLVCATTMNMEVIEPTLVILVGTLALLYFVRFIIKIFSLTCSIFVVLISLIRKRFLEGFCLSHSLVM